MAFFKSTPNLPDGERARIEFHLQQIGECIGGDRCQLPVLDGSELLADGSSVDQVRDQVGRHLRHSVNELRIQTIPMQPEKVGGGG